MLIRRIDHLRRILGKSPVDDHFGARKRAKFMSPLVVALLAICHLILLKDPIFPSTGWRRVTAGDAA